MFLLRLLPVINVSVNKSLIGRIKLAKSSAAECDSILISEVFYIRN